MKTLIIGYGNLGKIYADALLRQKLLTAQDLFVLCKTTLQAQLVKDNSHGTPVFAAETPSCMPGIVLLVVKPQDAPAVYETARKYLGTHTLVLSVMAGISIRTLTQQLQHDKIVRAMPNSPIAIGMGMTGYSASPALTKNELNKAATILATTGRTLYFEEEKLLNAVTAISGNGPAYFFYFLQCMIEAGKQLGLTEAMAATLAKQTMLGSFHLFNQSDKTAAELIATVASKGGTTEAAFNVFAEKQLDGIFIDAMKRACQRAGELNGMEESIK